MCTWVSVTEGGLYLSATLFRPYILFWQNGKADARRPPSLVLTQWPVTGHLDVQVNHKVSRGPMASTPPTLVFGHLCDSGLEVCYTALIPMKPRMWTDSDVRETAHTCTYTHVLPYVMWDSGAPRWRKHTHIMWKTTKIPTFECIITWASLVNFLTQDISWSQFQGHTHLCKATYTQAGGLMGFQVSNSNPKKKWLLT